jgi:hypothetical protein
VIRPFFELFAPDAQFGVREGTESGVVDGSPTPKTDPVCPSVDSHERFLDLGKHLLDSRLKRETLFPLEGIARNIREIFVIAATNVHPHLLFNLGNMLFHSFQFGEQPHAFVLEEPAELG